MGDPGHNGFLLNFTVAMRYSSVDKPEDYSHDKVLELMEEYPAVEGDGSVTQPVNIIAIMNESFADMTIFENLAVSDDPTPFSPLPGGEHGEGVDVLPRHRRRDGQRGV